MVVFHMPLSLYGSAQLVFACSVLSCLSVHSSCFYFSCTWVRVFFFFSCHTYIIIHVWNFWWCRISFCLTAFQTYSIVFYKLWVEGLSLCVVFFRSSHFVRVSIQLIFNIRLWKQSAAASFLFSSTLCCLLSSMSTTLWPLRILYFDLHYILAYTFRTYLNKLWN